MNVKLNPPPFITIATSKSFIIHGRSFLNTSAVYLSGYPYENLTYFNPFSQNHKLSSFNPGFYGLKLNTTQYIINNRYTLTVTLPPPTRLGFIDIILQNDAGWNSLKKYSSRAMTNPYPLNHPLRNSWEPFQWPWKDGIKVVPSFL